MKESYTHGHQKPVLNSHQQRTIDNSAAYLRPYLASGMNLLDIGAGPGSITADFARLTGRVTATEIGEEELNLCKRHFLDKGLTVEQGISAKFSVENVHHLSFANNIFDIAHAHQVIQHVSNPIQALTEMARVVRPGGYVAIRDADYESFFWFPTSSKISRWRELYLQVARNNGGEPSAGRRLLSYARQAGLSGARFTTSTWTYTGEEAQQLACSWAERLEQTVLGQQIVETGLTSIQELQEVAQGWREWGSQPGALFVMPHGELLWQKP